MTILTKDGKEYKFFSEPNPLVSEQEVMNNESLDFHNFKWSAHVEKSNHPLPVKNETPVPNIEEFVKTLSMPEEQKIKLPEFLGKDPFPNLGKKEVKIEEPVKVEEPKKNSIEIPDDQVLIVWVLPVKYVEKIDKVYGEIRKTKKYGQKYEIESAVLNMNDLEIQIITDTLVEKNAIIYASRFKSGDLGYARWWEVLKVTPQGENYIVEGIITDFHPDFSS